MDLLRQIEEDVRNLGIETKKKYPEVGDAVERALVALKSMREIYVSIVMKSQRANQNDNNENITDTLRMPRSSDLVAPYILLCNHADCSPKLVGISLAGIQMLLSFDVIPPTEVQNILRVLLIQIANSKTDSSIKILQLVFQLISLLLKDDQGPMLLVDTAIISTLNILFLLSDIKSSINTSSAASGTSRQVVALIVEKSLQGQKKSHHYNTALGIIIREICLIIRSLPSQHIRLSHAPYSLALDLLQDIMNEWMFHAEVFMNNEQLIIENVVPALKALLSNLKSDFYNHYIKGNSNAFTNTNKIVSLVEKFMLSATRKAFDDDRESFLMLLVEGILPFREGNYKDLEKKVAIKGKNTSDVDNIRIKLEEASAILMSGNIISKFSSFSNSISQQSTSNNLHTYSQKGNVWLDYVFWLSRWKAQQMERTSPRRTSRIALDMTYSSGMDDLLLPHPSACCIVAILKYIILFISDTSVDDLDLKLVFLAIKCALITICSMLRKVFDGDYDLSDLEETIRESPLQLLLLEFFESGEFNPNLSLEARLNFVLALESNVYASTAFRSCDLICLMIYVLPVLTNILLRFGVKLCSTAENRELLNKLFMSSHLRGLLTISQDNRCFNTEEALPLVISAVEATTDTVLDTAAMVLTKTESTSLHKMMIIVFSEIALTSAMLSLQSLLQTALSIICKNSLPLWHGYDLLYEHSEMRRSFDKPPSFTGGPIPGDIQTATFSFKWRHLAMMCKLFQVVYVICDCLPDWDCIVDCMEQTYKLFHSDSEYIGISSAVANQQKTHLSIEREKLLGVFDRFKNYTLFTSNNGLLSLMTSLVTLSMNDIALISSSDGSVTNKPGVSEEFSANKEEEMVSYSLRSAVDICKVNCYRISTVWQMIVSHLRIVASSKIKSHRQFAVQATFDLIVNAIKFQSNETPTESPLNGSLTLIDDDLENSDKTSNKAISVFLSYETPLVDFLLPSMDSIFIARNFHKERLETLQTNVSANPALSQSDLVSCLVPLFNTRYDDVKVGILRGLIAMLNDAGHLLQEGELGGWKSIIHMLGTVPLSMTSPDFQRDWQLNDCLERRASSSSIEAEIEYNSNSNDKVAQNGATKEMLNEAFACIKLISDEFLDNIIRGSLDTVKALLASLALFSFQDTGVNVSLTAVEILWKVADASIRAYSSAVKGEKEKDSSMEVVLELMLVRLHQISLDARPEVRHCAVNTLFTAMAANSAFLSGIQWRRIFEDVIFLLLEKAEARSEQAMRVNEEAVAPELKKGVKMVVHHSRDTAYKQWTETRVLSLRGLLRALRSSFRYLILEKWFPSVWLKSLELSSTLMCCAGSDAAVTSVEVLFGMLKIIIETLPGDVRAAAGTSALASSPHQKELVEQTINLLTGMSWKTVVENATLCQRAPALALEYSNKLVDLYQCRKKSNALVETELAHISMTIITLVTHSGCGDAESGSQSGRESLFARNQLRRNVMEFFEQLHKSGDRDFFFWAVTELCFNRKLFAAADQMKAEFSTLVKRELQAASTDTSTAEAFMRTILQQCFMQHSVTVIQALERKVTVDQCELSSTDLIGKAALQEHLNTLVTKVQSACPFSSSRSLTKDPANSISPCQEADLLTIEVLLFAVRIFQSKLRRPLSITNEVLEEGTLILINLSAFLLVNTNLITASDDTDGATEYTRLSVEIFASIEWLVCSPEANSVFKERKREKFLHAVIISLLEIANLNNSSNRVAAVLTSARDLLLRIISARSDPYDLIGKSACLGLVSLSRQLLNCYLESAAKEQSPPMLMSICKDYLQSVTDILAVKYSWCSADFDDSLVALSERTVDLSSQQRLINCAYLMKLVDCVKKGTKDKQPSKQLSLPSNLQCSLLFNFAMELLCVTNDVEMQNIAKNFIRAINVSNLVKQNLLLSEQNAELHKEIEDTNRQLEVMKSAVSIPF